MNSSHNPHVVLSGASGMIGSALCDSFLADGYDVTMLVRGQSSERDRNVKGSGELSRIPWQPGEALDPEVLRGAEAVICLNGATIGKLPWTRAYRRELLRFASDPGADDRPSRPSAWRERPILGLRLSHGVLRTHSQRTAHRTQPCR